MKTIKFSALLLTITAMVSCQKENPIYTYDNDPVAVELTATVSSPFTRSNLIDDATSTVFKTGDVVAVSVANQGEVGYALNGTVWTPQADKYLKWDAEALTFNAYYPAGTNNASMTTFDLPSDQSALTKIEQTDYMTYTSSTPEAKVSSINLALTRKMARVVITTKLLDSYSGYTVDKIEVHSNTTGYADGTAKNGQITIESFKHTDGKFYALLSPTTLDAATFLTITIKKNTDGNIETLIVKGIPAIKAGKSYDHILELGNNTVKITDVLVADWTVGGVIPGGEATSADPATHTVYLAKAGELTDFLIVTAMNGGKDLIITGEMGAADFTTILKWGTNGLTNKDAELIYTLDLRGVTGLTAVPAKAFYTYVSDAENFCCLGSLQRIDLPTTVTSVGEDAFRFCDLLASFTAPGLQTVKLGAFYQCTSLTKFTASKLQTVEDFAFHRCASLHDFSAPELLTIGQDAFSYCTSLREFSAPELQTMKKRAFTGCKLLYGFTTQELQTLGAYTFYGCGEMRTFIAPKLRTVGEGAFEDCSGLLMVTTPELQSVGNTAFKHCTSLHEFTAPKLNTIGQNSFLNCLLTELHLTTTDNITLEANSFTPFSNMYNCTVYLHQNKKNGGSGTPAVTAGGKWGGLTWKHIIYVNDNGTPVL